MKAVLMSIHPKYCELIFNREKTIEVRRSCPKLETPFEVLVYATKRGRPLVWGTPYVGFEERLTQTYGYSFADAERLFEGVYNGKVIGSFVCDKVVKFSTEWISGVSRSPLYIQGTYITGEQIFNYSKGRPLYGWHIIEPKLFDEPRDITEFAVYARCAQECSEYDICMKYDSEETRMECPDFKKVPLKRAPQSWMYVEEM